jgi:HSP20 family protein
MSPFAMMRRFSDEIDRAFSASWGSGGRGEAGFWAPAIEVSEKSGNVVVCAELPGMNKDDVKLEITDDGLVIQGERKREHQEERGGYHRTERHYGSFYRVVPLPEGAQVEKAKAQFNNGVLEVTVPVPEQQRRTRSIPIESADSGRKPAQGEVPVSEKQSKTG